MFIPLKDISEILMPHRKCKDALTPSQVLEMPQRNLTKRILRYSKGSYIFGSISACLDHEALSHCHAISTDCIRLLETKVPNSKNRAGRPRSLGTATILQRHEYLFQMPLRQCNILTASKGRSHARV